MACQTKHVPGRGNVEPAQARGDTNLRPHAQSQICNGFVDNHDPCTRSGERARGVEKWCVFYDFQNEEPSTEFPKHSSHPPNTSSVYESRVPFALTQFTLSENFVLLLAKEKFSLLQIEWLREFLPNTLLSPLPCCVHNCNFISSLTRDSSQIIFFHFLLQEKPINYLGPACGCCIFNIPAAGCI